MKQTLDLAERVKILERANRRTKLAGLMLLGIGAAIVLMGQAAPVDVPAVLNAHAFQLLDQEGRARGGMTISPAGTPTLGLAGKDGKVRIKLTVTPDGSSSIDLLDAVGQLRVELIQMPDGASGINLFDRNLVARLKIGLAPDGTPNLVLADKDGKPLPSALPPAPAKR